MARPLTIACGLIASCAQAWDVEIVAVDEVERLVYSQSKKSVYSATPGCHYAEFQLQCQLRDLPPGSTPSFQWTAVYSENPSNPPGGAVWVPAPGTAQSTVGWAFDSTGQFTAQCVVTVTLAGGGVEVKYPSKTFLAAGGPLKLRVASGADSWTGAHAASYLQTWLNDENRERAPHYLQYFGYSPTFSAPPLIPYPKNSQRPQLGTLEWYKPVLIVDYGLSQPVEFEWTLGPLLSPMPGQGNLAEQSKVRVGAEGRSGAAGIQPRCKQIVRFRGRTYHIWDNSDQSPNPAYPQEGPAIDHYCFTAHEPDGILDNEADDVSGPLAGHQFGWALRVKPVILDNLGHRMPNTWVQERFQPPMPPPQWNINDATEYWTTADSGLNAHPTGRFGPGQAGANGFDNLEIWGPEPWTYEQHPADPKYQFDHHYYAGTKHPTGTSGSFVASYRIKYWSNLVLHIRL